MTDELITPENVTKESIKALFDAAFMETKLDSDGDIVVKERCNAWVIPNAEKKRIKLFSLFRFSDTATELQKLSCVNAINLDYLLVKASVTKGGKLGFEYDICLDGGLTKKALVLTVKRFCSIPHSAIDDHGKEIVE